ncbi:MAG: C-terminal helicase domain-containing protein [Mycobacteriales bacterium]|nr:C-terminal helicase domain-containing protein [Mycobacteriales bacterium]
MHPAITSYVSDLAYDGRLVSGPGRERQAVTAVGLPASGIAVVDVAHVGNSAASTVEVEAVAELWHALEGGTFTDLHGVARAMTADDLLVVAPYNNQVGLLKRALPGARFGTVDKFQGQEAPAVIYSMTSSSAEDAPRRVSFLYDVHRLNVAVSRAQALSIVVMSPRLLEANVHTPEQLRQVNALCRLVEHAALV